MWLPPHIRRLLAKHKPYRLLPTKGVMVTLLAEPPQPWNPKPERKTRTPEEIRAYQKMWARLNREKKRAQGLLPPARHRWGEKQSPEIVRDRKRQGEWNRLERLRAQGKLPPAKYRRKRKPPLWKTSRRPPKP